jgi:hypothetical protein
MPDDIIYLTEDFEPVDKDDPRMAMVKVRKPDGTIVFGVPEGKVKENRLFVQGGPGSGFHGHKGRPGKVGGSQKEEGVALESPYRRWSESGVHPSSDEDDPYDAKQVDFHEEMYEQFYQFLDEEQIESIRAYTDGNYGYINRSLRGDVVDDERVSEISEQIDDIDSAFDTNNAEVTENILLYRGTRLDRERRAETIRLLQTAKNPSVRVMYDDPGYFSASVSEYQAQSFGNSASNEKFNVFFEVQVPRGSYALPIGEELGEYSEEQEMILPRGSRFEILYYTEDPEELPQNYHARVVVRLLDD